ncbi:MAG: hypothetical protein Q9203_006568 [Teloschistes exilis]
MEIVFHHTKGYLGEKDANEFGIPDVPNKPCLLLCPYITILALLFVDQAFAAPSLTSSEQLFRLRIALGQKQLQVPLKEELAERPLFRRCKNSVEGIQISEEYTLADTTLRPQMTNFGSITGMELPTGEITDAQRNIILQYYNSSVSQKNYISRYIPDTQAVYRGLRPQTALMRAASGMSRTIDPRRPRKLNLAQQTEVDRHPGRVAAINALIGLCKKQESQDFRRRRADIKVKKEQVSVSPPPSLSETLPIECDATQCIFCLGNEDLSAAGRLKAFATRGDLKKHFHRKHLRHHRDGQPIACAHPRCDVTLDGAMHLQSHAEVVHKTRT